WSAAHREPLRAAAHLLSSLKREQAQRGAEGPSHDRRQRADQKARPLAAVHDAPPPEPHPQADQGARLLRPGGYHGRNESARVAPRPSPTSRTKAAASGSFLRMPKE